MSESTELAIEKYESSDLLYTGDESLKFNIIEPSEWSMEVSDITFRPTKGNEPNWFHRKMQELILGFKWKKA